MKSISERQTLIQTVLLTAEQEMDEFIQKGLESDSEDIKMDSPTDSSDSSSSQSSILSSSLSSKLSSLSSSASSSSSSSSSSSGIQITVSDVGSDGEEHAFAMGETAALLQVIAETCVLNPHEVAKSSQLSLVLIEFKVNDLKCFCQNIQVSPHTMYHIQQ